MIKLVLISYLIFGHVSCSKPENKIVVAEENPGAPEAKQNKRLIINGNGNPFLWLGCTAWGMTEWLAREEVDKYLDDRKSKGMNVVQFCLFWGKRKENPILFTANPPNFYGHKAFKQTEGLTDPLQPDIKAGGSPENPNDYWDHVDYCLNAIKKRGMHAAVLPFWGRRYVNAVHSGQSSHVFTLENIYQYGEFLGKRYGSDSTIIWMNGGDVKADAGGDYRLYYRLWAEGLVKGTTGKSIAWNQNAEEWDELVMTYHPDGTPMINSSKWFQNDSWLDFNMIETFTNRKHIAGAIRQDLDLENPKPTVLGEPQYEGITNGNKAEAIHIRRQAYQAFFAGAAGFTYGGAIDAQGNGPLFSPANNWEVLLNMEGAGQIIHLRQFLEGNDWSKWEPATNIITGGAGTGETEKLSVLSGNQIFIYYPENTSCKVNASGITEIKLYSTKTGETKVGEINADNTYSLPEGWEDGILIISTGS